MSAWLFLLSLFSYMLPIGFFFYIAVEVQLRARTLLNRLSSWLFYSIMILFTSGFLTSVFPADYAAAMVLWFKLIPSFFIMSFALHLTIRITGRYDHWSRLRVVVVSYWPAACSLLLLIPSRYVSVHLMERGVWKDAQPSLALFAVIMIAAVYTIAACSRFLYQGMKFVSRAGGMPHKRKQVRFILWAFLLGGSICIGLSYFNHYLFFTDAFSYPEPSMMGLILFAFMIRYAMTRYEFLPSIERRYKILYERSPVAILLADRHERVIEANPAAQELFGRPKAFLLKVNYKDLLAPYQGPRRRQEASENEETHVTMPLEAGHTQRIVTVEREQILSGGEPYEYLLIRDITESVKAEERIMFMAYHDPLTGLGNRRRLQETLPELLLGQEGQENAAVALLMMDLDHFKHVNDTRGHHVGDLLLRHVAGVLQTRAGDAELICRLGGDEFALLFQGTEEETERVCEAILEGLREPFEHGGEGLAVSASIGVCLSPAYGTNPEQLLQYADMAMYEAKRSGRGRYAWFTGELKQAQESTRTMELQMAEALKEERFVLYYQPQVDLQTEEVCGVEALIRWVEQDGTVRPPGEFIPLAEENGSIVELGRWVLEEACRTGRAWLDEGGGEWSISINVSNRELAGRDYLQHVDSILEKTGFPPGYLQLEMTESTTISEEHHQLHLFTEIAGRGIRLAMDDFGTGYSTFSVIQMLPFHIFKLDKSMIDDIVTAAQTRHIVKAMIIMAHSLSQRVVAEGVETAEQVEVLRELGCDAVQGYFYSKPLPEAELLAWLKARRNTAAYGTPELKEG
ncbi:MULTISPECIES: EAL domain-containing protein [Paenibacillus]|uniref:EAL domain-containing protein n=1 Tax=Paenibacillus TaxID=44249 RepID=UPI0022B8D72C|nr:EAL domain-containing protein [Paenibacillus caseinilyticus]MCZ8522107.1 EAL domain-containing protein [Paenibacillus caseinilyticus]